LESWGNHRTCKTLMIQKSPKVSSVLTARGKGSVTSQVLRGKRKETNRGPRKRSLTKTSEKKNKRKKNRPVASGPEKNPPKGTVHRRQGKEVIQKKKWGGKRGGQMSGVTRREKLKTNAARILRPKKSKHQSLDSTEKIHACDVNVVQLRVSHVVKMNAKKGCHNAK